VATLQSSLIQKSDITGVVLAGGQGSRMGGVDKGVQPLNGEPLALHVLRRLTPQTGAMLISANRSIEIYTQIGTPFHARVITDTFADFPGPLAGIAAALQAANTAFVLTAPCDAPFIDPHLAARFAEALSVTHADIAFASVQDGAGERRQHPVFALLRTALGADLDASIRAGERKVRAWYARHKAVEVTFADERAFYNINDLQQLADLERS
jgi:molybdopterin-guanine dinucleotide biosynthesis protein A